MDLKAAIEESWKELGFDKLQLEALVSFMQNDVSLPTGYRALKWMSLLREEDECMQMTTY